MNRRQGLRAYLQNAGFPIATGLARQQLRPVASTVMDRVARHQNVQWANTVVSQAVGALRDAIRKTDPLRMVSLQHTYQKLIGGQLPLRPAHGSDAVLELLSGLVTEIPVTRLLNGLGARVDPSLVSHIYLIMHDLANAALVQAYQQSPTPIGGRTAEQLNSVVALDLRLNRTQGIRRFVQQVRDALFAELEEAVHRELGFSLMVLLKTQQFHCDSVGQLIDSAIDRASTSMNRKGQKSLPLPATKDAVLSLCFEAAPPVQPCLPALLAEGLGAQTTEVRAALRAISTDVGSQSEVTSFGQALACRSRPVLRANDDVMIWPSPWDWTDDATEWLAEVVGERNSPKLSEELGRARTKVSERMITSAMQKIFGRSAVNSNVFYDSPGARPELDVLVQIPGGAIVIEAKGGRFTPRARYGSFDRQKKHIDELLIEPALQAQRAARAIIDTPESFCDGKGQPVVHARPKVVITIAVTLERIPGGSLLWSAVQDESPRLAVDQKVWAVSLADLLCCADLLQRPEDFVAYASQRASMQSDRKALVETEIDAIDYFMKYRFSEMDSALARSTVYQETHSTIHNFYYSAKQLETRPTVSLPNLLRSALEWLRTRGESSWTDATLRVMAVDPNRFAQVERLVRLYSLSKLTREQRRSVRQLKLGIALNESLSLQVVAEPDLALLLPGTIVIVQPPGSEITNVLCA